MLVSFTSAKNSRLLACELCRASALGAPAARGGLAPKGALLAAELDSSISLPSSAQ
jgi:hypothetical protein